MNKTTFWNTFEKYSPLYTSDHVQGRHIFLNQYADECLYRWVVSTIKENLSAPKSNSITGYSSYPRGGVFDRYIQVNICDKHHFVWLKAAFEEVVFNVNISQIYVIIDWLMKKIFSFIFAFRFEFSILKAFLLVIH
jgi:hypothetical protein